MTPSAEPPYVSVAIPAYNSEEWIGEAIASALGQSLSQIEIVVADDASTDGTVDVVASFDDPRIRLYRNPVNLGHSGNWNHVISLCRAPFVKFLCADDLLREDCVERKLSLFERSERVGLVFSRRRILFPESDPEGKEFWDVYNSIHLRFGPLEEINSGRTMFARYAEAHFEDNWIGEPTNVMMRRSLLERLHGFHPYIHQASDMELWIRALFHTDVGFVNEPLSTYRIATGASLTDQNFRDDRLWLDRLWIFDSLLRDDDIRHAHPELRRQLRKERLHCGLRFLKAARRPEATRERLQELRRFVLCSRGLARV